MRLEKTAKPWAAEKNARFSDINKLLTWFWHSVIYHEHQKCQPVLSDPTRELLLSFLFSFFHLLLANKLLINMNFNLSLFLKNMVYRVRYKFFFPIFHPCQSCKLKAKLIKVNGECIFFLLNFLLLLILPFHTNSTDLALKIKNAVEKRKGIIKLPRWFTNSDTGFQRWLGFQGWLNWQDVEKLVQLRTDRPSCEPAEICEAKFPGTFGLWKLWFLHSTNIWTIATVSWFLVLLSVYSHQSIFHPGCGCFFPRHNSDDIICKLKTFNDFLYPSIYKLQPIGQIQTTTCSYK